MKPFFGLLTLLFNAVAFVSFIVGAGTLLYDTFGIFTGRGFEFTLVESALYWALGDAPPVDQLNVVEKGLSLLSIFPLALVLMALGWLLNKIGTGFEKLS